MAKGFLRQTRKWPKCVAVAALWDIDAVGHKKTSVSVQTN